MLCVAQVHARIYCHKTNRKDEVFSVAHNIVLKSPSVSKTHIDREIPHLGSLNIKMLSVRCSFNENQC